jgi:hypothetical protein
MRAVWHPGACVITSEFRAPTRRSRTLHFAKLFVLSTRRCPARRTGSTQRCGRPRIPHQLLGRTRLEGPVIEPELHRPAASLRSALRSWSGVYAANGRRWRPRDGRIGPEGGARRRARRAARDNRAGDLRCRSSLSGDWRRRRAGNVLLVRFAHKRTTRVAGGENARRTLQDANGVEMLALLGSWDGSALNFAIAPPADGEGIVVLVQAPNGRMLGAATSCIRLDPF